MRRASVSTQIKDDAVTCGRQMETLAVGVDNDWAAGLAVPALFSALGGSGSGSIFRLDLNASGLFP